MDKAQPDEQAEIERAAWELYLDETSNDPIVHCNRFPSWSELSESRRDEYRARAALRTQPVAAIAAEEALTEALKDPHVVHVNMLRGGIAKPSPANIWHIYRRELLDAMPNEFRSHPTKAQPDEQAEIDAVRSVVFGHTGCSDDIAETTAHAVMDALAALRTDTDPASKGEVK